MHRFAVVLLLMLVLIAGCTYSPAATLPKLPDENLTANPYSAEDFAFSGDYLTCLAGKSVLGIDVSHHQQEIRWQEVAASPVEFAMIRVGYRGLWDGLLYEDRQVDENLSGARQAGLPIGVYFYSQAISVAEAEAEADFLLQKLDGTALEYPVVFDWEIHSAQGRNIHVDAQSLHAIITAFCERVKQAGYQPMVYFNQDIANRLLDLHALEQQGYDLWLAMYSTEMTWQYQLDMWQYSCTGTVPGIDTEVDINLYFQYE